MPPTRDLDDLLRRGINTARSTSDRSVEWLTEQLVELWDGPTRAAVLARALRALADPARVGDLRDLRDDLAVAMFDNAHESCNEDHCAGGGLASYREFVDAVLLPALAPHTMPQDPSQPQPVTP